MGTIFDALTNVERLISEFPSVIEDTLKDNLGVIKGIIQEQLMVGIDENEKELRPTYLEDPYFATITETPAEAKKKAKNWFNWKKRITPPRPSNIVRYPARDDNTPNLIIKGNFHDSITPRIISDAIVTSSEGFPDGSSIEKKYGSGILGISPRGKEFIIEERLYPAIEKLFKKHGL